MTRLLSIKFRFCTFMCIVLLAWVHGYNLNVGYLTPFSTVDEPLTFTTWFEYFIANGLLRFRIPMLFMISGYLYAWYDNKTSYSARTKKRFRTLIIPYLLWSALALLFTYLLQQVPFTASIVRIAQIDQLGDNRPYNEIGVPGILYRWLLAPIAYQLWFILSLFVYNLAYPVLRWLVERYAAIWLVLTGILWFLYIPMPIIGGQGLFYFSFGVWLCKAHKQLETPPRWLSQGASWIIFVGLCTIKTFMAFELPTNAYSTFIILGILYNAAVLSGIVAVWFSVDELAKWFMVQPKLREISGYSFFIYGLHIPLLPYVMQAVKMYVTGFTLVRITSYLWIPAFIVLICIFVASFAHRRLPRLYNLLSGGRGI